MTTEKPHRVGNAERGHRPPIDIFDAAAYVGDSERHLRRLVAERRIPFVKLAGSKLRFMPDDLDRWLDAQRVEVTNGPAA